MSAPLADRMRPQTLTDFIGQEHLTTPGKILHQLLVSPDSSPTTHIPSLIFWGPPGTGKTTLARIIANQTGSEFIQLSATLSGVKDIREAVSQAKAKSGVSSLLLKTKNQKLKTSSTILFIDEIHRFNKSQQDSLLPHVEDGTFTFIGATTENPSFEVNSALLSRSRVLVLNPLSTEHLETIIKNALTDHDRGLGQLPISISEETIKFLAEASHGDARVALNALELAIQLAQTDSSHDSPFIIHNSTITEALQNSHLLYDRAGDEHYNTISAFIKSLRASQPDAALYYLARMVEAGEDPLFIARRLVIFASEDIGLAQPTALVVANAVFQACHTIGYPECAINLAHGVTYLANCPKNRSAYDAYFAALADVKQHGNLPIPMEIRNAPTQLMKNLGYGQGYQKYTNSSLLPSKLKNKKYLK